MFLYDKNLENTSNKHTDVFRVFEDLLTNNVRLITDLMFKHKNYIR